MLASKHTHTQFSLSSKAIFTLKFTCQDHGNTREPQPCSVTSHAESHVLQLTGKLKKSLFPFPTFISFPFSPPLCTVIKCIVVYPQGSLNHHVDIKIQTDFTDVCFHKYIFTNTNIFTFIFTNIKIFTFFFLISIHLFFFFFN